MLYISLGSALVYLFTTITRNPILYQVLQFDRALILRGQVWRLFTYPLTYLGGNMLFTLITLLCYYSLGRAMENYWGTLKFNLFYLTGVVLMDIYSLIFNCQADVYYLNLSLFLSFATLNPNAQFLLFFIIPIKAWFLAVFDLALVLFGLFEFPFTAANLFPVIALANYFLFFGREMLNVFPMSWQINARKLFRKKGSAKTAKTVPFPNAGSYQATTATPKPAYTHRCTVCGRTDVTNPELEFRYCSRCNGYYCYCEDHINNHAHIQ